MRVVHMHHINAGDFSNQVANFLARGNAVCATPKVCPGRYSRDHRVGLSLEAEPVRLNGEIVSFATSSVYRDTMGDSWLWPGSVTSLRINAFTQPDRDTGEDTDETHRVSTDLAAGWPLRSVVEVWIIPATARLRGITLDASVYSRHKAEIDAVASEHGVRVHVVPDVPRFDAAGDTTRLYTRRAPAPRARTTPAQRRALSRARRTTEPAAIPAAPEMYVRRRTEADW